MAERFVKAVEISTGNVKYVPAHHLDMYPTLLKPAPSTAAKAEDAPKKNGAK